MRINKWLKRTGIIVLVIGVLALAAHLLIVNRARQILNYMVMEASGNRYTVRSGKVRFRYIPFTIYAKNLEVAPVDSASEKTFYVTSVDSLTLQVTRLIPLFSKRNLSLENVKIIRPLVSVYDHDTASKIYKPLNLALDDIQHALLSTLSDFSIKNCQILDGGIQYKQFKPGIRPFFVNRVSLTIRNLYTIHHQEFKDSALSFKADVRLEVNKPLIQLPDPGMNVYVDNLLLDTRQNIFSINRINLYNRNEQGTVDSVNLSNINLKRFNWNRWLKEGLIEIDSLRANNGATFFDLSEQQMFTKPTRKTETSNSKRSAYVDFIVHHVEINKIAYGLRLGSASGPFNVQLDGDSLAVGNISLSNDSLRPLKIGSLAFKLSDFSNEFDSRKNKSTFEKLIIDNNSLELVNYKRALNFKNVGAGSSLTIPSLRLINFSLDDLLQYKLVADKVILDKPAIIIDAQQSGRKRNADEIVANITAMLKPSLIIKQLSIRDAAIILLTSQKNGGRLSIEELNTEINARQLLQSKTVLDMIASATALSSTGFKVTGPNINLVILRSKLNSQRAGIFLQHVEGTIGNSLYVNLNGVGIANTKSRLDVNRLNVVPVDDLNIASGIINIKANDKKGVNLNNKTPSFIIENLKTGAIDFTINTNGGEVFLKQAEVAGRTIKAENGNVSWDNLQVNTSDATLKTESVNLKASSLQVSQPGSIILNNINLVLPGSNIVKHINIPSLSIDANFNNSRDIKAISNHVVVQNPLVLLQKKVTNDPGKQAATLPLFSIKHLQIIQPVLKFLDDDSLVAKAAVFDSGQVELYGVETLLAENAITAKLVQGDFKSPLFNFGKAVYSPRSVSVTGHDLLYNAKGKTLSAEIDAASMKGLNIELKDAAETKLDDVDAGITNYSFTNHDSLMLARLMHTPNWWATASRLSRTNKNHFLTVFAPFVRSTAFAGFDSLHLYPRLSKDSFWSTQPFEKDYNTLNVGATSFKNWQLKTSGAEKALMVELLSTSNVDFLTLKDKTRAPDTVTYRPLLANSLKRIPFAFAIDTISIKNSVVDHFAILDKSKRQGNIFFTSIGGYMYNLRNSNIRNSDTLKFRLTSRIMAQGDLLVGFSQSYTDSLQGFSLKAKLGRLNLTSLNRLLVPLVSIKIDRGITDSLLLSVGANDFVAYGSMDMRYHGLRVSLLKKGEKKYFLSSFSNWLINVFIHSKDDSDKNVVFQERLRNRSIYNFWGKIAINGLLSNLGIKRDKKQIRKYNKGVKQGTIPAVDENLL